jgi:hypothetical protein
MESTLKVIGAGLPRTGTSSLQKMLAQLLEAPCYHMRELYARAEVDGPRWMAALAGDLDQLDEVLAGWSAVVDWPASVLWAELADRHPEALVVLSHRGTAQTWWTSADVTVWQVMRDIQQGKSEEHVEGIHQMMRELTGFSEDLTDWVDACRIYEQHYQKVVATIPPERLLIWQPGDGWEPLCERLGVAVPDEAPAHANTRADFRERF